MSKRYTNPTIYDNLKTVTIAFLKTHKYLEPGGYKGGNIIWTRNGQPDGNIDIKVSTLEDNSYLELDYQANGTPINYRVKLVTIPSNLGKGFIWYFLCPATGKLCRKLYLAGNYFYHRTACRGMYEKQTQSKKLRDFEKMFGSFDSERLYTQLYKKNFKKTYAGKPTRKYLRLSNKIDMAERVPQINIISRFFKKH
jgi:hypothetical protein